MVWSLLEVHQERKLPMSANFSRTTPMKLFRLIWPNHTQVWKSHSNRMESKDWPHFNLKCKVEAASHAKTKPDSTIISTKSLCLTFTRDHLSHRKSKPLLQISNCVWWGLKSRCILWGIRVTKAPLQSKRKEWFRAGQPLMEIKSLPSHKGAPVVSFDSLFFDRMAHFWLVYLYWVVEVCPWRSS